MYVYDQESYQRLAALIDKQLKINASVVVVAVPGVGTTICLKSYLMKNDNKDIAFITDKNAELKKMNILDLDFHTNDQALAVVDNYMKVAMPDQKFIVVIDSPAVVESEGYKNSYCAHHVYDYFYFSAMSRSDCDLLALGNNPELKKEELEMIFDLSGGIGRIAKYLAISGTNGVEVVVRPIGEEIRKCSSEIKEKLELTREGKYLSKLVSDCLEQSVPASSIDIVVNFDLTVQEKGKLTKAVLTKTEKDIVNRMIENGGIISKEDVSDIKWGMGKYDEFSDQAINKTMRRLSDKLTKYEIETITKVGYRIQERK